MCDKMPGTTARAVLVPTSPATDEARCAAGDPDCRPAKGWIGRFSRRAFLLGTAACPMLLMTPLPVAAPVAAVVGESWEDETFWDDGTGWI